MFYRLAKRLFCFSVNMLNLLVAGNLPPFVTVCAIVEKDGRYLVVESSKDRFSFPGGFVRWRELPVQAAQREGKEETGLHLSIRDVVGYYPCASAHLNFRSTSCLVIAYHAEVIDGELRNSIEGKPTWLDESAVRAKMGTLAQLMLHDYLHHTCTTCAGSEAVEVVEQVVV